VNLEKLRLQEHIDINFSINIENENKKIAPLLFIPLLENAFKHSNRDSSKALINISIEENEKTGVKLLIENTKDREVLPKDNKYGGLGIQNVKKRLELIYPGKHSFIITDKDDFFIACMELEI
jgi:LytS/YehU family sensor histidine kinase